MLYACSLVSQTPLAPPPWGMKGIPSIGLNSFMSPAYEECILFLHKAGILGTSSSTLIFLFYVYLQYVPCEVCGGEGSSMTCFVVTNAKYLLCIGELPLHFSLLLINHFPLLGHSHSRTSLFTSFCQPLCALRLVRAFMILNLGIKIPFFLMNSYIKD